MKAGNRHEATGNSKRVQVFGFALGALLLTHCVTAEAQQGAKIPKIGWLAARPPSRVASSPSGMDLFWREFGALGYVRGKNIAFEYRSAENKLDRLPALAEELVHLKVDVIIAAAIFEANAAKKATKTIPVVFFSSFDPVEAGLVDSLARPGGNLTGFSNFQNLLTGKRLEILKETIPKLVRVAVLHNPETSLDEWKENQRAAKTLGLQLHPMEVSRADKFETAFTEAIKAGSSALTVTGNGLLNSNLQRTIELAVKYRLPAIYIRGDFAASGGLMSYGADQTEPYRRVAVMVDKVLKGAKPADLPVEQPTKFEFVINLKAAKQIGLTIPPNVLARADRIIR
jgi:putative tryptophan/tyrosine transport system substrate-binding protein